MTKIGRKRKTANANIMNKSKIIVPVFIGKKKKKKKKKYCIIECRAPDYNLNATHIRLEIDGPTIDIVTNSFRSGKCSCSNPLELSKNVSTQLPTNRTVMH